jgi:hypothetical protein
MGTEGCAANGLDGELSSSDLDDVPLVLSDSDASPGPSQLNSARSEHDGSGPSSGGGSPGPGGGDADADAARSAREGEAQRAPAPRALPKLGLALPGLGGSTDNGQSKQPGGVSLRSRGETSANCGGSSSSCVRSAKPPPLALFVTSASSPVHSPARGGIDSAADVSGAPCPPLALRRPAQLQQQQLSGSCSAPVSEPVIHVQLLLPAFDLLLPAGGGNSSSSSSSSDASSSSVAGEAPAAGASAVRSAIARALGVSGHHLAFFQVQPSELPEPCSTQRGGSDHSSGGGRWGGTAGGSTSSGGSRLVNSSSSAGTGRGGGGATATATAAAPAVVAGSVIAVGLSDGSCTFCLADLEDSLRRAEAAGAALREQGVAHEALQQELVLKGMEAAERAADCGRWRERHDQLQHEMQRLKCAFLAACLQRQSGALSA